MKKAVSMILALVLALALMPVALAYSDVSETSWCYDSVCRMRDNGLMFGTSAECFSPDAVVTRGMAVTVLHRYAGCPEPEKAGSELFIDVTNASYCDKAIGWAFENDITLGYDEDHFKPNEPVTRQQLVTFLYRYAVDVSAEPALFPDYAVDSDDWGEVATYAKKSMEWAAYRDILNGTDADHFSPNAASTRAQYAVIMGRFIDNMALTRVTRLNPVWRPDVPIRSIMTAIDTDGFASCIAQMETTEGTEPQCQPNASIKLGSKTYFFEFSEYDDMRCTVVISSCAYEDSACGSVGTLSTENAELMAKLNMYLGLYCFGVYDMN